MLAPTLISIVIVNSDTLDHSINCLQSIFENPPECNFEVILVDNRSKTPCLPLIIKKYPQVQTILAPQRQGFAKNYNLGIRQAKGDFILILNNDTLVHPGSIDKLIDAIIHNKSYGMVGPKIINKNGKIQVNCNRSVLKLSYYIIYQVLLYQGSPLGKLWDNILQYRINKRGSGPVFCISGACMLITREAINQVGLLNEELDFYFEDDDWCHRLHQSNFQVGYIEDAEITHIGNQSLPQVRQWAKKSEYKSAIYYFSKYHHITQWQLWILWAGTVTSFLSRTISYAR